MSDDGKRKFALRLIEDLEQYNVHPDDLATMRQQASELSGDKLVNMLDWLQGQHLILMEGRALRNGN